MSECSAKPRGNFGKVLSVSYDAYSYPTTYSVSVVGDGPRKENVTLWVVSVQRECGQGGQFAYIDPDTNTLWFVTAAVPIDANGNMTGDIGLKTLDDNGAQINKVVVMSGKMGLEDIMDPNKIRTDRAADGTMLTSNITIGNANNGAINEMGVAVGGKYKGGKRKSRKSRKSKKSKRQTRR